MKQMESIEGSSEKMKEEFRESIQDICHYYTNIIYCVSKKKQIFCGYGSEEIYIFLTLIEKAYQEIYFFFVCTLLSLITMNDDECSH